VIDAGERHVSGVQEERSGRHAECVQSPPHPHRARVRHVAEVVGLLRRGRHGIGVRMALEERQDERPAHGARDPARGDCSCKGAHRGDLNSGNPLETSFPRTSAPRLSRPFPGGRCRELADAIHASVSKKTPRRPLLTSGFSQNALRPRTRRNVLGRIRKPSRSLRCAGRLHLAGDVPAKRHTRVDYKKKNGAISTRCRFENEGHGRVPSGSDSSIRVRVGRIGTAPSSSSQRGAVCG
jgi:hypothetical protein